MTTIDLDDDLTTTLGGEPVQLPDETPDAYEERLTTWRDQYTVTDLADADWLGRGLRRTQARIGAIDQLAARRKAEIDEWADTQRARHAADLAFFAGRLEQYHRAEREADPKHNKSLLLPCGVSLRSQAGKISVVVTDENAATLWLEANASSTIEYPAPKIIKTEVAKLFGAKAAGETAEGTYPAVSADGEIVPGVELVRGSVSYTQS